MNRIISLFLCCWALLSGMQAQELTVREMKTTNDLSASQHRRVDYNHEPCGLIKVRLATKGATFEGNVIQPVEYKTGEYWVYMTKGSKELHIKHPSFLPVEVHFDNYDIKGIQPLTTYTLTLVMPQFAPPVAQTSKSTTDPSPVEQESGNNIETVSVNGVSFNMVHVDGGTLNNAMIWKTRVEPTVNSIELVSARLSDANSKVQMLDYLREYVNNPNNHYKVIPSNMGLQIDGVSYSLIYSYNQAVNDRNLLLNATNEDTSKVQVLTAKIDEYCDSIKTALLQARRKADINRQNIASNLENLRSALSKLQSPQNDNGHLTISDYWIGETEVTQKLWKAVMGSNPSEFQGDNLPVEQVSWNDCQEFISKLSNMTGRKFRLPNESEWIYAERGGSKSKGYDYSGSNTIDDVAWYGDNSSDMTHPVKIKLANELGLYDMSGNVGEWCQEWYNGNKGQNLGLVDEELNSLQVIRGSSWNSYKDLSSDRKMSLPDDKDSGVGLRLAL